MKNLSWLLVCFVSANLTPIVPTDFLFSFGGICGITCAGLWQWANK